MRRECRERFPRHIRQRKPVVSDPGMHHGTCVTHVPWYMSGLLARGGGKYVAGIPGACATRNFTYLTKTHIQCHALNCAVILTQVHVLRLKITHPINSCLSLTHSFICMCKLSLNVSVVSQFHFTRSHCHSHSHKEWLGYPWCVCFRFHFLHQTPCLDLVKRISFTSFLGVEWIVEKFRHPLPGLYRGSLQTSVWVLLGTLPGDSSWKTQEAYFHFRHLEGLTGEARPVSGHWGPTSSLVGSVLSQLAQSTNPCSPHSPPSNFKGEYVFPKIKIWNLEFKIFRPFL